MAPGIAAVSGNVPHRTGLPSYPQIPGYGFSQYRPLGICPQWIRSRDSICVSFSLRPLTTTYRPANAESGIKTTAAANTNRCDDFLIE